MSTILVVEDDAEIANLMALTLRIEEHEALVATDDVQALEMARSCKPDLIVMDVVLPQMSGFDVARALQSDPATDSLPIIFVTAKDDIEDKVLGLQLGVDYITKPFAVPEFLARVSCALRVQKVPKAAW